MEDRELEVCSILVAMKHTYGSQKRKRDRTDASPDRGSHIPSPESSVRVSHYRKRVKLGDGLYDLS